MSKSESQGQLTFEELTWWARDRGKHRKGPLYKPPGAPEQVYFPQSDICVGDSGRHYPFPGQWDIFTNPERPQLGQVAAGDVLQAVIPFGLKSGSPFSHNVLNFNVKTITGTPALVTVAAQLAAGIKRLMEKKSTQEKSTSFRSAYGPTYGFTGGSVRSLTSTDEETGLEMDVTGDDAAPTGLVPLRSAMVMSISTAKKGRSYNGRNYWPAPDESRQTGGNLNDLIRERVASVGLGMMLFNATADTSGVTGFAFELGIYSRKLSKQNNVVVWTPASGVKARDILGSQRNRQDVDTV